MNGYVGFILSRAHPLILLGTLLCAPLFAANDAGDGNSAYVNGRKYLVRSPIEDAERKRIEDNFERFKGKKPNEYQRMAIREVDRLNSYDKTLAKLPKIESKLISEYAGRIDWFSVTEVNGIGHRITALRIDVPDADYAKDFLDRRLGKFASEIPKMAYLESLYFNGSVKEGLNFSKLGNLPRLKFFQPPVDANDRDLTTMSNIEKLEYIDLSRRKTIRGTFANAFGIDAKLRDIDIRGTNFTIDGAKLLLRVVGLKTIFLPEAITGKERETKAGLRQSLENGSFQRYFSRTQSNPHGLKGSSGGK